MQRGDRLLSPSSCEFSAVDGDLGGGVGKKLSCTTCKLLEAHEYAFGYFGGVFGTLRYDNLKAAVKKILRGYRRDL
jgi:hypothetical protein